MNETRLPQDTLEWMVMCLTALELEPDFFAPDNLRAAVLDLADARAYIDKLERINAALEAAYQRTVEDGEV